MSPATDPPARSVFLPKNRRKRVLPCFHPALVCYNSHAIEQNMQDSGATILSVVEALLREFTVSICMVDSNNRDQVVEDINELHRMLHEVFYTSHAKWKLIAGIDKVLVGKVKLIRANDEQAWLSKFIVLCDSYRFY